MKQNEKNIVAAIMQFPRLSTRKLAEIAGVSQPTVSKQLRRLQERGVLSYLVVLGLDKLGYEIVALNTIKCSTAKDRTALNGDKSVVFAIEIGHKIGLVVSVHKNYDSYDRFIGKYEECDVEPYKATILFLASKKPIKPFSFKDICL